MLVRVDHPIEAIAQRLQMADPLDDLRPLVPERGDGRGARVVDDASDLVQLQPQLAVDDDAAQPVEVARRVEPVSGSRSGGRAREVDLVPVVQRPDRQVEEGSGLTDGQVRGIAVIGHGHHPPRRRGRVR